MTSDRAENSKKPCFEIGLVMAGAISAGAYTAGVMDFLMEALDAYYTEREKHDWDGPRHDVRISVMAGASAGGMTSAISALHAFRDGLDHFWPTDDGAEPSDPRRNRLYSSWVNDIDLLGKSAPNDPKKNALLDTSDLDGAAQPAPVGVTSLLCCDVIDEIVEKAFDLSGNPRTPEWIGRDADNSLRVLMTLTNLRGVSYSFKLFSAGDPRPYGTLNHGDYLDFQVYNSQNGRIELAPGAHPVDILNIKTPGWDLYREAAKATGAFPVGLKPRLINRPREDYKYSLKIGNEIETEIEGVDGKKKIKTEFVTKEPDEAFFREPNPAGGLMKDYEFVTVDGGTIDNEPLELARRFLAQGTGRTRNPRSGDEADRAVLMIAPFPNFLDPKNTLENRVMTIMSVVPRLFFKALIEQARFKPDELRLAASEDVFSRYIIAPEREGNGSGQAHDYPIACGVLGAFGGFLHKSFRRHDYLLGRRNAQQFLRCNFALPTANAIMEYSLKADEKGRKCDDKKWQALNGAGKPKLFEYKKTGETLGMLPIIPLIPRPQGRGDEAKRYTAEPIVIPEKFYPNLTEFRKISAALYEAVSTRAKLVVRTFIETDLKQFTSGALKWPLREAAIALIGDAINKIARGNIEKAIGDVESAFDPYEKPTEKK